MTLAMWGAGFGMVPGGFATLFVGPSDPGATPFLGGLAPLRVNGSALISFDGTNQAAEFANGSNFFVMRASNVAATAEGIQLVRCRGTFAAPAFVQNGDSLGRIRFAGVDTTGAIYTTAGLSANATELHAAGAHGSSVTFFVVKNATTAALNTLALNQDGSVQLLVDAPNQFQLAKCASAAAAPGAGVASLRFVAGTNPGTGKLVACCGTSAVPVTIVDNVGGGF